MLTIEEIQRIEDYSAWNERQRYSDEELWKLISARYDKEVKLLKAIPFAYRFAYSDAPDYKFWRELWQSLVLELNANGPVMEAIAWHLTKRGDPLISSWLGECEENRRVNSMKWQRAAWGIEDE